MKVGSHKGLGHLRVRHCKAYIFRKLVPKGNLKHRGRHIGPKSVQKPTSGVHWSVKNLRRLILSTWPHSQRGKLTAEYMKSHPLPKFPEARHQVVVSIHSPEPSPELKCLLLFSESSSSSRSVQDHLAEEMLSVAVTPYIGGYGNRKVGHLDPNFFPD